MKLLVDNGHGNPPRTGGKCSPDERLREYDYAREIARRIVQSPKLKAYAAELLTPETTDISLTERVRRVNAWCDKLGSKNVLLVSVHNNAANADGKWHDARGFSVYVSKNASATSKRVAATFTDEAKKLGLMGNRFIPACKYWTWPVTTKGDIAILANSKCPAVLTENLYMDNIKDVDFLLSEEGKQKIVDLHINSILTALQSNAH